MEKRDFEIDKFIAKYKAAFPDREEPPRELVAQWIEKMIETTGHITYPLCGLKWDQVLWQSNQDIDLPYSACANGENCERRKDCLRYKLYKKHKNEPGNTCILYDPQNCNAFIDDGSR
ncbi:hypothetical protein [Sporomusa aerivorans]|uniref:hypothetical protein n=1 Tax=Sporomusa aerivorans TaxID=204936 RepID=UPI00352AF52D